jgi:hypothetical protein
MREDNLGDISLEGGNDLADVSFEGVAPVI